MLSHAPKSLLWIWALCIVCTLNVFLSLFLNYMCCFTASRQRAHYNKVWLFINIVSTIMKPPDDVSKPVRHALCKLMVFWVSPVATIKSRLTWCEEASQCNSLIKMNLLSSLILWWKYVSKSAILCIELRAVCPLTAFSYWLVRTRFKFPK